MTHGIKLSNISGTHQANMKGIVNPIQVVELPRHAGLSYAIKEETREYSSDKSETIKDAKSASKFSIDHNFKSFPNGSENSK